MKPRLASLILAALAALVSATRAQVIIPDPSLPVVYPNGEYRTPAQVHAEYAPLGNQVILTNIEHLAFDTPPVNRFPVGPDEHEMFSSGMFGMVSVNGSPYQNASGNGPVETVVFGKVGNTTGTFQTEMLSMSLTGTSPFGPFMIRESPTLASTGQTTITDLGGGLYRIDSFFDVFTELSIDNGINWFPDTQGPARVNLGPVPEPSVWALAGLGAGLLALRRAQWLRKRS